MEFANVIPDGTKKVILTRVIKELEIEIWDKCTMMGVDMAALAADYAAPAEPEDSDGLTYVGERQIESLNTRIVSCKAQLAALG
jgi:hypothetical protein